MSRTPPSAAPAFQDLPPRRSPSGEARSEFTVQLKVVSPILGGGYRVRELDDIDTIRVPTVRGHLRFWWRALFAGRSTSSELYVAETELWGGAGGGKQKAKSVRSRVEVRVEVNERGAEDDSDIDPKDTKGAYALFPARAEKKHGEVVRPQSPRRIGVAFKLTVSAPASDLNQVRNAVQAWILFGGYGGRTRRGLGSLTVTESNAERWLPHADKRLAAELQRLFGGDVFAVAGPARQTPMLAGADLYTLGRAGSQDAWRTGVDALRDFRQGAPQAAAHAPAVDEASEWARKPGVPANRPSLSNWPEPDKIRQLTVRARPYSHAPRHSATPVWPRAGFGLPIVGRFQTKARGGGSYEEPPPFTLKWRERGGCEPRERLASPLILKALPLANQQYVAIALWLHRAWPEGEIVLEINKRVVTGSAAPFDPTLGPRLVAHGDTALFTALHGKATLRAAFFDWLKSRYVAEIIVPHRDAPGGTP